VPTVAVVEGVSIRFYYQEHPPPHFHAVYAEHRVQIGIEPLRVLKGGLPPAKLANVLSWAEPRRRALLNAWHMALAKKEPEKIQ